MKFIVNFGIAAVVATVFLSGSLVGQDNVDELRKGKIYKDINVYSLEKDQAILKKFEGLRVADVSDGMDKVGLKDVGLVHPSIEPLWKDLENFTHQIVGIAVTVRYIPTNKAPADGEQPTEEFDQWVGQWYNQLSPEPFTPLLRDGSVLVIEEAPHTDVGSIGSYNIMAWRLQGARGVVTSGTARDTDEIIVEGIPLYYQEPGRGIRPGRNEVESVNRPVVVGGVTVYPGDVVVADGDGVIVVPRDKAEEVAEYARLTIESDKAGRRALYEKLGLPMDETVK
ncbi:MAG: RraA family protein [Candidatus Marinimicrobia bacterium]|nr:RraA family protein [Candidatus Neomarinimicrobiota bacterium]